MSLSGLVSSPAIGKVSLCLPALPWGRLAQSQGSIYHLESLPYTFTAVYTSSCDLRLSKKDNVALERETVAHHGQPQPQGTST